jgi:hypothetical protein
MVGFFLVVFLGLVTGWILLSVPVEKLARGIRLAGPILMIALGAGLLFLGRGGIGFPLIAFGLMLYRRLRTVAPMGASSPGAHSNVRSAALEMELDHDTGEMDGLILAGGFEGRNLSDLSEDELLDLVVELRSDEESVALLEAYLDRRIPGWGEDADSGYGAGHVATPRTGSMGKQEAYEVLGLDAGAGQSEIRKAHRRLMKGMHPDSGGSTFLAAKINEAKEVLLKGHN